MITPSWDYVKELAEQLIIAVDMDDFEEKQRIISATAKHIIETIDRIRGAV